MSNLFLRTLLGNLFVEPFLQHCFGTFLDNLARQPIIRNLAGETVIESLAEEPCFETMLGNVFVGTMLATYCPEPS
jgi:hypothetical protein